MARSAGSGNAAWKASRAMTGCKPGNINRRRYSVVRKNGTRCNGIAVKGFGRCFHHGGSGFMVLTGRKRWKMRRLIRLPRSQLKTDEQLKAEARLKLQEMFGRSV